MEDVNDKGRGGRTAEILTEMHELLERLGVLNLELTEISGLATAPHPAQGSRLYTVKAVQITPEELAGLAGRPGIWQQPLDHKFDPPLSSGQLFVLAVLHKVLKQRSRLALEVALPKMMADCKMPIITRARREAMWLLHTWAGLDNIQIAELFGKQPRTVMTYLGSVTTAVRRRSSVDCELNGFAEQAWALAFNPA